MAVMGKQSHDQWLYKRKLTTIAFAIESMLIGCEYGIFIVNEWLYITELVKPHNPEIYYSLISISYLFSAAVSSIFICQRADQSRNIRKIFFFLNTALIVGNIIYMIPFSPWILFLGRIIAGVGQPGRSVIAGELARCYPRDEISTIFAIMGTAHSFGFMVAPCINIAFTSVDIWIGNLHITYANISGLYMAVLFLFAQIMGHLMVHDLSKEYDLKSEIETANKLPDKEICSSVTLSKNDTEETCLLPERNGDEVCYKSSSNVNNRCVAKVSTANYTEDTSIISGDEEATIVCLFKQLLTHRDTLLLLGIQFLETFFVFSFDMCLPILIINKLEWSVTAYNAIMLSTGLVAIFPCIFLIFKTISDKYIFCISAVSISAFGLLQIIQMVWAFKCGNAVTNIVLGVIYGLLFADIVIIRDVFVGSFLSKMVTSRHQALADSIRIVVSRMGAIVAMCSAVYALGKIEIVGSVYIGLVVILQILLILRRRTIKHPSIIIY